MGRFGTYAPRAHSLPDPRPHQQNISCHVHLSIGPLALLLLSGSSALVSLQSGELRASSSCFGIITVLDTDSRHDASSSSSSFQWISTFPSSIFISAFSLYSRSLLVPLYTLYKLSLTLIALSLLSLFSFSFSKKKKKKKSREFANLAAKKSKGKKLRRQRKKQIA